MSGRRSTPVRRGLAVLGLVLVTACGGSGGSGPAAESPADEPGRGVTADEANRLAVARFNTYERDVAGVEVVVPTDGGQVLTLQGRADMRDHRALTSFVTDDPRPSHGLLAWNFRRVALLPTGEQVPAGRRDALTRGEGWQVRSTREQDALTSVLLVLLNLAADRPDNAQLLRQNGATWQGETEVDGVAVTAMTASPDGDGQTVTYYVDAGGLLVRADVETGLDQPASIVFTGDDEAAVPAVPTG